MRALFQHLIPGRARELLAAEHLLLEGRGGFQRAAPYLVLFLNLFANGYLHPLIREDPAGLPLALFFFLKSSAIAALFLLHYLTVSDTILQRTGHLPIARAERYFHVVLGGLRTPAVFGLLLTDLLFLAVIFGESPAVAAVAVCALTLLVLGTIGLISGAGLVLRRSSYPVTAMAALGALGFVALATALIVFRADGLLAVVPLVWLTQTAVGAALHGAEGQALAALAGLAVVSGAILYLGRKFA